MIGVSTLGLGAATIALPVLAAMLTAWVRRSTSGTERLRSKLLMALQRPSPKALSPAVVEAWDDEDGIRWQRLVIASESGNGSQSRLPLLIARPPLSKCSKAMRLPAVIFAHPTGSGKETCKPYLKHYASSRCRITVSPDLRYHGERNPKPKGTPLQAYYEALIDAWRAGSADSSREHPFVFDMAWDVMRVVDYLHSQDDVDTTRIGATGISLGGMATWIAGAADTRISVLAPAIGVQSFGYAVNTDKWQARVATIQPVFDAAATDRKGPGAAVDAATVAAVWDVITPGLLQEFDAPMSLPLIAPRPLLISNGELDPRCWKDGLETALESTRKVYAAAGISGHFEAFFEKGVAHKFTDAMAARIDEWFAVHLDSDVISERTG
eukprot:CAMPEP_0172811858 /NCGR_PEP_ID=MMETSP1075-20121228/9676_1 /TAXON_ID=2916 /ORGANISM="Ceratium fusus, Strain PA161109" /LENGTH=381 /DNA_ID=CAMNT_0013651333 /DNA_START=26 /DNA_END=1171 /DNA_ORIENTATION=-